MGTEPVRPLVLTLDLSAEPADYIIYEGTLAEVPVGRLAPGESRVVEMPLSFVSCGHFQLGVEVRELGARPDEGRVGFGMLKAVIEEAL